MSRGERMNPARCRNDIQRNHLRFIKEEGVSILSVASRLDDPDQKMWTYSIGLWQQYQHPDVIIFGLDRNISNILIDNVNWELREENRRFPAGSASTHLLKGYTVYFEPVATGAYGDYLVGDDCFYGDHSYPVVQVIWPTVDHMYPWQNDASQSFRELQPVISSLPKRALQ